MKEKSIIFNAEMVRAILDGRKTQTRRELKPQPAEGFYPRRRRNKAGNDVWMEFKDVHGSDKIWGGGIDRWKCPYGQIGDKLWVRETWCLMRESSDYETGNEYYYFDWDESVELAKDCLNLDPRASSCKSVVCYPADGEDKNPSEMFDCVGFSGKVLSKKEVRWRLPVHMPRWVSRITLEITNIRVEKLCEIDIDGIKAEGLPNEYDAVSPAGWFANLWGSINGEGSWGKNPWVWVIEFKKVA